MEAAATRRADKISVKRQSNGPQSYAYVEIVLDFARKRDIELRFLAFWDFAFERFVIP